MRKFIKSNIEKQIVWRRRTSRSNYNVLNERSMKKRRKKKITANDKGDNETIAIVEICRNKYDRIARMYFIKKRRK